MEQVQIIAGGDLATVFRLLAIEATKLIRVEDGIHDFQVWELPKTEYERFSETVHTLEEWDDDKYVWWRDGGSNIELNEVVEVEVNGRNMKVHNQDCEEEPYIRSYEDIFELCCEYYGVSKETNVACIVEDLATLNGMTKAEFIKMYASVFDISKNFTLAKDGYENKSSREAGGEMREVKFRGFSILLKKWIYGIGLSYGSGGTPSIYVDTGRQTERGWYEVAKGSEGQFTGLKDRSGETEIYEGDIVEIQGYKGRIVFVNGSFCVDLGENAVIYGDITGGMLLSDKEIVTSVEWLVVGTVYENQKAL